VHCHCCDERGGGSHHWGRIGRAVCSLVGGGVRMGVFGRVGITCWRLRSVTMFTACSTSSAFRPQWIYKFFVWFSYISTAFSGWSSKWGHKIFSVRYLRIFKHYFFFFNSFY
jgi:hypothetical protein